MNVYKTHIYVFFLSWKLISTSPCFKEKFSQSHFLISLENSAWTSQLNLTQTSHLKTLVLSTILTPTISSEKGKVSPIKEKTSFFQVSFIMLSSMFFLKLKSEPFELIGSSHAGWIPCSNIPIDSIGEGSPSTRLSVFSFVFEK